MSAGFDCVFLVCRAPGDEVPLSIGSQGASSISIVDIS